ncbi:MAG: hypothetical protein ACOC0M_00520 [Halomonas sp.]
MRYGFVNNFSQLLAADLDAGATTMTLDGGGSDLSNASEDLVYALTLDDGEGKVEILHVTGADGDELTIERGKEGTSDATWPVGTTVEMRLTAGALSAIRDMITYGPAGDSLVILADDSGLDDSSSWQENLFIGPDSTITEASAGDVRGAMLLGIGNTLEGCEEGMVIGYYATISHDSYAALALGQYAEVIGRSDQANTQGTAIGPYAKATCDVADSYGFSLAVGSGAQAHNSNASAFGAYTEAEGDSSLAIGSYATTSAAATNSVSVGVSSETTAAETIAVGNSASATAEAAIAAGHESSATAEAAIAVGAASEATATASVAIGHLAVSGIEGGLQINGISYLRNSPDLQNALAPEAAYRASQQVVLATEALDLTDDTASVNLDMPAGTMLFIDSIDTVIVASDGAGGSPEITVGPDDQAPADYLASTAVSKTSVGGRESHDPLVSDGVTTLRVATAVAGSGTEYQAKVVFRGYVMEL